MTLRKIAEILKAIIVSNSDSDNLDVDIHWASSTDLISNILFYFVPNSILITGLVHPQVVQAAEVAGMYTVSGKLLQAGLQGCPTRR